MLHALFAYIGPVMVDLDLVAVETGYRQVPKVEGVLNKIHTGQDVLDRFGVGDVHQWAPTVAAQAALLLF